MKDITIIFAEMKNADGVISVTAVSNEAAVVSIWAQSLQEAFDLTDKARQQAEEAMRNWKPEEPKEKPEQPARPSTAEYEASPEGQRFIKRLQNAYALMEKHSKYGCGLRLPELTYLYDKYHNSLIEGGLDIYALGYKLGFRHGKAAAK